MLFTRDAWGNVASQEIPGETLTRGCRSRCGSNSPNPNCYVGEVTGASNLGKRGSSGRTPESCGCCTLSWIPLPRKTPLSPRPRLQLPGHILPFWENPVRGAYPSRASLGWEGPQRRAADSTFGLDGRAIFTRAT